MPRQLGRDVPRRRARQGQITQHRASLCLVGLLVAAAEHRLRAGLVQLRAKQELSGRAGLHRAGAIAAAERPAREYFGEAGDVGLRIAGADAERMQLENLARQILVQTEGALAACRALRQLRIRSDRALVVQIQQHRRVLLHRQQQLTEIAEHMRPYGFALQAAGDPEHRQLVDRDGKMIAPEIHQPFDPRALCDDGIAQACLHFGDINWPVVLRQARDERQHLTRF